MSCKPTYKGVRYNSVEDLKSSIITPQQKQQALQMFQEYVEQTGRQDIVGFKKFVTATTTTPTAQSSTGVETENVGDFSQAETKGVPKSTPKSKISGESSELIDSLFGDSNENVTFGGLPESILRFYNSLSRKEQKALGSVDKLILEYQELGLEASEEDYIESLKCKL